MVQIYKHCPMYSYVRRFYPEHHCQKQNKTLAAFTMYFLLVSCSIRDAKHHRLSYTSFIHTRIGNRAPVQLAERRRRLR